MTGGKATKQGHSFGVMHPLNMHACSLITRMVQMLQEPPTAESLLSSNTREYVLAPDSRTRQSNVLTFSTQYHSPTGPPFEVHSPLG